MSKACIHHLLRAALTVVLMVTAPYSFADQSLNNSASIYSTSIKWDDEVNKKKLLEFTPKWQNSHLKSIFNAYLKPENYQFPQVNDAKQYNTLFINAFWGPLNNPFNQYSRPAKAFVFFNEFQVGKNINIAPKIFYTAPLIQDDADGNYYVFDKNSTHPVLLNDWVTGLKNMHNNLALSFNVCNGYGNLPTDSCESSTYQSEVKASISSYNSFKENNVPSAMRAINEDWKKTAEKFKPNKTIGLSNGIYEKATSWEDIDARQTLLNTVVEWPNHKIIRENFEKIRNIRYFQDEGSLNFQRRISWLFPDDGCWTRASAVIKDLFGPINNPVNSFSRPAKVFVFGNLCANTSNSPSGRVSWWYHTAPIIRDAETNQTYVLDPSVDAAKPLTMEQWVTEITANHGACADSTSNISTFAICNGYGTNPYDRCKESNYLVEASGEKNQLNYQKNEYWRQKELGRDPNKVLGDLPPWLN